MAPEFSDEQIADILAESRRKGRYENRWKRRGVLALTLLLALTVGLWVGSVIDNERDQTQAAESGERQAERTTGAVVDAANPTIENLQRACEGDSADDLAELGVDCEQAQVADEAIDDADAPRPPRNGVDGADATLTQVLAATSRLLPDAIAEFCEPRNDCTPPAPEDGTDGTDGANATQEQVDNALTRLGPSLLAAFCSNNNGCRGPAGTDGTDGESVKGEPGRGISGLDCTGTLTPVEFTITYTDGTTSTVTCGPGTEPDPTEETP